MPKFKVGDTVRINDFRSTGSINAYGEIGVITEYDPVVGDYRVHVKGRENRANWHLESHLERVVEF